MLSDDEIRVNETTINEYHYAVHDVMKNDEDFLKKEFSLSLS